MSIIPKKWDPSWNDFMNTNNLNELKNIEKNIGNDFFPEEQNVLRFINNDLSKIKCIIVGMEPYCTSSKKDGKIIPEATGRSFEVNSLRDKTWDEKFRQSSLRNIVKTIYFNETGKIDSIENIRKNIKEKKFEILNPGEWFDKMEENGVLFLNATLTVKPNVVDSHTKIWDTFINNLINYIIQKNPDVVWLLWGNKAQDRFLPLINENKAICSSHPRLAKFVEENCFQYVKNINWRGI